MPRFTRLFFIALGLAAFCGGDVPCLHGVVLDWSTQTWPAGALSHSFDVDPASPGNDLTITFTGDTNRLQPSFTPPNAQTPVVSQTFQGGFPTLQNSLEIRVDYTTNLQAVTLTIDFSGNYTLGVRNVSFTIFDIDNQTTYQDQIRSITALSADGVTLIAPTITGVGSAATATGSGLNQTIDGLSNSPDTGAGSGAGNATINFGAAPIRSLTFTYGNVPGTQADPTSQKIGLFNLSYEVVPEASTWALMITGAGLLFIAQRRR